MLCTMIRRMLIVVLIIAASSCGKLFWVKIDCRKFDSESIKFAPGKMHDTISYVNDRGDVKHFVVSDKRIHHTTDYISDTGCSCLDNVKTLYLHERDSMWIDYLEQYVYDNKSKRYMNISAIIDGKLS